MGRAMLEREAGDDAARIRIGVGGAVALEVIENDQSLGAGRQRRGGAIELVIACSRAEQLAEPRDDRAGRGLAALHRVQAGQHGVGVGAEDPLAVEGAIAEADLEVGGAGDQRQAAGIDDAEADDPDEGIGAALGHRQPRGERHDLARPFVEQRLGPQPAEQRGCITRAAVVVMPAHRGVVEARHHAAGEVEVEVVLKLADVGGRGEEIRLMGLEPERLGDHPFGRDRAVAVAVHRQCRIPGGRHPGGLAAGAHIHPDQGRAQWMAGGVERDHAAAGGIERDRSDVARRQPGGRQYLADRRAERLPPVDGILLGPARLREAGRVGGHGVGHRCALQVEDRGAQAFGAGIDTDDEGCGHGLPPHSPR